MDETKLYCNSFAYAGTDGSPAESGQQAGFAPKGCRLRSDERYGATAKRPEQVRASHTSIIVSERGYAIPHPNLFDFGNPFGGSRPASARLPRHSANSFMVALNSRPAESRHFMPSLALKTVTSDSPPSL